MHPVPLIRVCWTSDLSENLKIVGHTDHKLDFTPYLGIRGFLYKFIYLGDNVKAVRIRMHFQINCSDKCLLLKNEH